jgi:hypothetical protein
VIVSEELGPRYEKEPSSNFSQFSSYFFICILHAKPNF